MIKVTKEQAMEIRKKLPYEKVVICNRQSSAKKRSYYAPETYGVMKLLRDMQDKNVVEKKEKEKK